ncbi:MAG TPA: response regulator transcription factor [Kofleriaceae bacterium]|nr:response regulator transcription factor [Kofleriaceae bacterium]
MSGNIRILVVEDDRAIATGLALNLRLEGYAAHIATDGEQAHAEIAEHRPDLILLDISLPKKSGLDLLRDLRTAGDHTPVIVLSAREGEYDKVAALRLGADDYVTKPFALAELMARVAAVLRRARAEHAETGNGARTVAAESGGRVIDVGDLCVEIDTRQVTRMGTEIKLTHLEFELLSFFVQNPSRVFSRAELLRRVWGLSRGSQRTVDNFVAQLRSKLEYNPDCPRHLITVRGSGYRFDT